MQRQCCWRSCSSRAISQAGAPFAARRWQQPRQHRLSLAHASASPAAQETAQGQAYHQLIAGTGTATSLEMRPSPHQNGLFTTKAVSRGEVMMTVPKHICLIIDYNAGLSVPSTGTWPRLKQGLAAAEPLTWDLLMALALLDGLAGDGGSFWQSYCEAIFPAPNSLTLPMCWSRERLQQLQHEAIVDAALQQQERLARMFPEFAEAVEDDAPSWFQWAFACVRSRAYKLGDECFAIVPFWDLANHGVEPNTAFRADASGSLQLLALKDLGPDQEVLISYTGEEGYTNQRLMAQYGFVLPGGNPADRVPLTIPEGTRCPGLSLERIQSFMTDQQFVEMISAKNVYGYAALKSLPLMDENQVPQAGTVTPHGDMELARALLQQCDVLEQGCATTLQQDEDQLRHMQQQKHASTSPQQAGNDAESQGQAVAVDERHMSALEYRVERKRLLRICRAILRLYVSGSPVSS